MSFFRRRAARESALLIDVGSGSVGAAYLSHGGASKPALLHAVRVPTDEHEPAKAVAEAVKRVVTEGAPLLRDATGSGHASRAVVAIASPWQKLHAETVRKEAPAPFSVTNGVLKELTEPKGETPMGFEKLDATIIAILLNGYQVREPIGKKAKNAEAVVVTTYAEQRLMDGTRKALRELAHIREASFVSFPWISYEAIRELYPHERDYLILDAAGRATDISVVSRGLLADSASAAKGTRILTARTPNAANGTEALESGVHVIRDLADKSAYESGKQEWLDCIVEALGLLAKRQALPRTIFLLADPDTLNYVQTLMDEDRVRSLWLTSEQLSVMPVAPSQLSARIVADSHDANDAFMLLVASEALRTNR